MQRRTSVLFLVLAVLGLILVISGGAAAAGSVAIYDTIPVPYPGGFPSLGYQATSTDEFGDHIQFTPGGRQLDSVVVSLTDWACETGGGVSCVTTPGSGFNHPITLNLYAVDHSGPNPGVGPLIASKTQTFFIYYRPSADPLHCTAGDAGKWYSADDDKCYNGYAFNITFDFSSDALVLPDELIYGIAYNTQTHGASPIGVAGPYNSLNVSLASLPPTVGTDVEYGTLFWDTSYGPFYCDNGLAGTDTFRRDAGCWDPYTPVIRFNAHPVSVTPTTANTLVCNSTTINIDVDDVAGLQGYEFKVTYDPAKVSATGAFINSWFDTGKAFVPPGWNASCSAGTCKFAAGMDASMGGAPVNGSGMVAQITLTKVAAGVSSVGVTGLVLSDLDGFEIANQTGPAVEVTTCGSASVSGKVSLQGRLSPMDPGNVEFIDPSNTFSTVSVPFDTAGNFSASLPVLPSSTSYTMRATHILYVGNAKTLALLPGDALTGQNTRLFGGDADNSGLNPPYAVGVDISDLTCIGSAFGGGPATCGVFPAGSTDINKDAKTNIQDLAMTGGNYGKNPYGAW